MEQGRNALTYVEEGAFDYAQRLTLAAGIVLSASYIYLIMKPLLLEQITWLRDSPLFAWWTASSQ